MPNSNKRWLVLLASALTIVGAVYVAAAYDGYFLPFFGPPGIYQVVFGAALAVCSIPVWRKGLKQASVLTALSRFLANVTEWGPSHH